MSLPNSSAQAAISDDKMRDCFDAGAAVLQPHQARHQAARHHDEGGVRKRHHRAHRARRLHQCRAPPPRHGPRGRRRASPSTTSSASAKTCPCSPTSSRPANTSWPISSNIGGTVPLMKMLLDAGLLHGDCMTVTGRTMARKSRKVRQALSGRPADHPPASTIRSKRTATCASSTATSRRRRRGRENLRQGRRASSPARPACSTPRTQAMKAILGRQDQEGRRHRHPHGRPERRPRHARNARAHQRRHGPRPRQGRRAHHRRPLLRRQPRFRRRPHHPGSLRAAAPSASSKNGDEITIDAVNNRIDVEASPTRKSPAARPPGSSPSRATPAACSRNTPSSSPPPAKAR